MRAVITACLIYSAGNFWLNALAAEPVKIFLDNNLRCIDLSDLTSNVPLTVNQTTQILGRTEPWEHNTFDHTDNDSVGYPSVVKNDRGRNPDGKYYLFYAHHDPCSCIGCAVSDSIEGPYRKLSTLDRKRRDSIVLANPHYPVKNPPVSDPSHFSSPCVLWNEKEKLWFMYFHYYNHFHEAWKTAGGVGYGHQMTALATCPSLASHTWTIVKYPKTSKVSVWDIVPVLPTTELPWMNSQSSYHTIQRLADGRWLAFLRGTSVDQVTQLGFATSQDGRKWTYSRANPVIRQNEGGDGKKLIFRPYFAGYLGKNKSGKDEYLLAWGESPADADVPKVTYGYTTDFITIQRDPRGYADLGDVSDGQISPWREGNKLYLFTGKHLHVMILPVSSNALEPTKKDGQYRRTR